MIYFTQVLGAGERPTEAMAEGKEGHERFRGLERRRSTVLGGRKEKALEKWTGLPLTSRKLGLTGVADLIVRTEKGYSIIEFKNSKRPRRIPEDHVYQAAAYALLAEERFRTLFRSLLIHYAKDGETVEIPLTESIRNHVKWTVERIRRIIKEEVVPKPKAGRCGPCGYKWICKGV